MAARFLAILILIAALSTITLNLLKNNTKKAYAQPKTDIEQLKKINMQEKIDSMKYLGEQNLEKFKEESDDFQGVARYFDEDIAERDNAVLAYIKSDEGKYKIGLQFKLAAEKDYIIADTVMLNINGNITTCTPTFKREYLGDGSKEVADYAIDERNYALLDSLIIAPTIKIRYKGRKISDRTLTPEEKQSLKETVETYKLLTGNLNKYI